MIMKLINSIVKSISLILAIISAVLYKKMSLVLGDDVDAYYIIFYFILLSLIYSTGYLARRFCKDEPADKSGGL